MWWIILLIIIIILLNRIEGFSGYEINEEVNMDVIKNGNRYFTVDGCHYWPYLYHMGYEMCDRVGGKFIKIIPVACGGGYGKALCVKENVIE